MIFFSNVAILVATNLEFLKNFVGNSCQDDAVSPSQDEENKRRDKVDDGSAKFALLFRLHRVVDLRVTQLGCLLFSRVCCATIFYEKLDYFGVLTLFQLDLLGS